MKNVLKPLAKIVLIILGLTAAASVAGAGMDNKILGSWARLSDLARQTISSEEMDDIMTIVKSLEESGF